MTTMQNKFYISSGMLLLMMALSSCGLFSGKSEYDKVPAGKALEVPPDLDEPSAASAVRVPNATYSRLADGPVTAGAPVGVTEPEPETGTRIESGNGGQELIVDDSMESAWRLLGFALQKSGFKIEDQARVAGVYSVEFVDVVAKQQRPGAFSRWIMRKKGPTDYSGTYHVQLESVGEETRVQLRDDDGERAAAKVNDEILTSLLEQLE
jgi:uncharacterized lipoprotein